MTAKLLNGIRLKGSNSFQWSYSLQQKSKFGDILDDQGRKSIENLNKQSKPWFEDIVSGPIVPIR